MRTFLACVLLVALASSSPTAIAAQGGSRSTTTALDSATRMQLVNARALWVDYRGRRALKLAPLQGHERDTDQAMVAILTDSDFGDGTIEVEVSGARRAGYATDDASAFKGFVGISFRVHGDSAERIYVRPENARLDDQLFRNRSIQYESDPDWPWQRLRRESPGAYESYADMEAGAWTRLRIEVEGTRAKLFVDGAAHPALIVNDLKLGRSRGRIALWARISSDAYFSRLRVARR
jgi:hypothetical protein